MDVYEYVGDVAVISSRDRHIDLRDQTLNEKEWVTVAGVNSEQLFGGT